MDDRIGGDRHLKRIVEKSQFWDAEDLIRNFDREMDQLEHGLGHMIWDVEQHRVTACLRPLPMTPSFTVSEDEREFRLKVKLPGVSKEDIRLNVDRNSAELLACSGDLSCRPYYVNVIANGELAPESAEATFTGEVFEVCISKVRKRRLEIK